ncbi:MAG: M16 family metallopeptidase, partial [Candidatus Binatia bacterium]
MLLAITLLLAVPLVATSRGASPYAARVRENTLPNGLKILLLEDHKAPVAVMQVWYRAGARNEQVGKTGLAHLLEHLMFKGTKKVGPEEYSRIIQRNGGNDNAFTSDDATTYFATLASDRLGVVIDLEADRMQNLSFGEAQFAPEHRVVMEERRLRTDNNPVASLFELVDAVAFTAHPYQWPTIGWMEDVRRLTRDDA